MSIVGRIRGWFGRLGVKGTPFNMTPPWARWSFMKPTFRALTEEGYKGNGLVFACISALAFAFPEPPMLVWKEEDAGKSPLRSHALSRLLRKPNPDMGLAELLIFTIVYMAIGGNCYWYKVRNRSGKVVEIWPIHDGQITPIAGGTRLVSHYEFDNGGDKPERIEIQDIVHFRWAVDPLSPWRGLAPLVAIAREVDTDNEATRYLFSLLKNDATPRLAIVARDDLALSDPDVRQRTKLEWSHEHGGENRGKVALLEGGLDIKTIALNLKELEFNLLRFVPEARMCAAFRVPVAVAGAYVGLEKSTYNNQGQQFEFFTDRTLVPLWGYIDDKVTSNLLPEFDGKDDEVVEFDLDRVQVLAEKKAVARKWAEEGLGRGSVTLNEYRAAFGLKPDPNGDVYLRTLAIVVEPFGGGGQSADQARAQNDDIPKSLYGFLSGKSKNKRRAQEAVVAAQRQVRGSVAKKMEKALDAYFDDLADRVVSRAKKDWVPENLESKKLPKVTDLIKAEDEAELLKLTKRFYTELIKLTWGYWDIALGVDTTFDLKDPLVTSILGSAGERVKSITDTTRDEIIALLQYGNDNGWSIDQLVRGEGSVIGLRDLVTETYKGRARTIARTELGTAQNLAATGRYKDAGVKKVLVLDNGLDDDDDECRQLNGAVKSLAWAEEHSLGHPNCTRCFAPEID